MDTDNTTFEEQFTIRASEIDFDQKATMSTICNLLQEVAGNHARKLKFDITDLQRNELTWVLHRLNIKMDRMPEWRETITVKTWPSSGDGLRAYRDFLILDHDQKVIGKCLSYWLILNIESRRPVRIPKEIMEMAPKETKHVLSISETDFPDIEVNQYKERYQVRKTDLDLNKHVNNVHYVEWALSALPENHDTFALDISFLGEALLNDHVEVYLKKQDATSGSSFYHELQRSSDGKVLAKAISSQ